jgi:hypothetical protein
LEQGLEQGLELGLEKGLKEGLQLGLQEGIKEGIKEGHEIARRETIRTGYHNGIPIEVLCLLTGYSADQVREIILKGN